MNVKLETPPAIRGEPEQQIRALNSYLFRLAEALNVALNTMTPDNYSAATSTQGTAQKSKTQAAVEDVTSYNELRALSTAPPQLFTAR